MSQRKVLAVTVAAREIADLQIETSEAVIVPLALTSPRRRRKRTRLADAASPAALRTLEMATETVWRKTAVVSVLLISFHGIEFFWFPRVYI